MMGYIVRRTDLSVCVQAKKFMSDLSPSQITAKTVLRELRRRTASLYPPQASSSTTRPSLQLPQRPIYSSADRQLVGAWKLYLKWEESNPLDLEDKAALISRLQVIYRKAMIRMRFFSEIWYVHHSRLFCHISAHSRKGIWPTCGLQVSASKMMQSTYSRVGSKLTRRGIVHVLAQPRAEPLTDT